MVIILTATSAKTFGRLILRIEPEKDLPSKVSAAEASSGVKNSKSAWHFSLCICNVETVSNTYLHPVQNKHRRRKHTIQLIHGWVP